jgi:hypothetical protein
VALMVSTFGWWGWLVRGGGGTSQLRNFGFFRGAGRPAFSARVSSDE